MKKVDELVRRRAYRTVSHFVREAIDDKLRDIERRRLADLVDEHAAAGYASEDPELVLGQAFGRRGRRAKR